MFTFQPRRTSQPYANPLQRPMTPQLMAMLRGQPLHGPNPMDRQRLQQHLHALLMGRRF